MRYLSLALLACLGCPSHPSPIGTAPSAASATASSAPSAPSATADASGPKWPDAAARAPAPLADAAKREYAKASPFRHDELIHPILDRVASQEPTAAGLRAAAKILEENAGAGGDMKWAGSGTSPAAALLHAAGMALLADLVTRACEAAPKDAAIGSAIESIPLPPIYGSARDQAAADRDRNALRTAGATCGLSRRSTD